MKGDVTRIEAGWAAVDTKGVVAIDDPSKAVTTAYTPQCLASSDGTIFVGTAESHLYAIPPGAPRAALVESFDRIPTRNEWHTPWGAPADRGVRATPK